VLTQVKSEFSLRVRLSQSDPRQPGEHLEHQAYFQGWNLLLRSCGARAERGCSGISSAREIIGF
jgi:hypothetical protein